ncbi:MAG: hypothetical protein ACM3VZ_01670 [Acidobacteriota bacterium]
MNGIKRARSGAWVLACVLTLSACGGGGGSSPADAGVSGQPGDGNGNGNGAFNPGLTGRIYYDSAYGAVIMDLASGRGILYSDLSGLRPSADGSEMLETSRKKDHDNVDQLRIRDEEGRTRSLFEVSVNLYGPRFSPDRQTIAAWWSNKAETGSYVIGVLTLFSRAGDVLAQVPGATSFAWMPDGHLLYTAGTALYRVDHLGGQRTRVATVPESVQGLSVSPDGRHLAMEVPGPDTAVQEAHIWFMNMDGSGLRQMTVSSINETDPVWIGDGSWLIARQGVLPHLEGYSGCPALYAIPADADKVELTEAHATRAIEIKTRPFDTTTPTSICPFSTVEWAPPSRIMPAAGHLPASNGLINRGLTGVMAFQTGYRSLNQAHNWLLDVTTGAPTEISNAIDGFDASRDGMWLASTSLLETDSHSYTSELAIRDLQGKLVQRFEKPGMLSGPVRFSPDGKRLLFVWSTRQPDGYVWTDHIVVANLAGDVTLSVTGYDAADWLPDGGLVVSDAQGLHRVDPQFKTATPLLSALDPIGQIRVSPDGQSMAFAMINRIWTVQLDGSGLRQLTQSDGGEFWPEWSPDGRYVAVAYRRDPSSSAYWAYPWVVAADARHATVGLDESEQQAFAIRQLADGASAQPPMTTRFSWR